MLIIILCIALLPVFFGLCYTIFSFTFIFCTRSKRQSSAYLGSWQDYARAFLYEWFASNIALYQRVGFRLVQYHPPLLRGKSDTAVCFVHGFMDTPWTWSYFKRHLMTQGDWDIHTLRLLPRRGSIEVMTDNMVQQLARIRDDYPGGLHLVAHSLGGLVCAKMLTEMEDEARTQIKSLTTIGTPWNGTLLACFEYGECVRQMTYDGAYLHTLRNTFASTDVSKHIILSDLDTIIVPWQSCIAGTEHFKQATTYTVHHVGHVHLLYHQPVMTYISEQLLASERAVDA